MVTCITCLVYANQDIAALYR